MTLLKTCGHLAAAPAARRLHVLAAPIAALATAITACDDVDRARAVASGPKPAAVAAQAPLSTDGSSADNHVLYAANGIACDDCHACGRRSPDGHDVAWMDARSAAFHARAANENLASCQLCHGPELDGVGGSTTISCAACHGATWRSTCTTCHGGVDGTSGAPPRATWGNGDDAIRVGAHTAHVAATHGLSTPVPCASCHAVPLDALSAGHADAATATVTFAGLAARDTAPVPWDRTRGTCGVYCHGATLGGGAMKTPDWTATDGAARACDACHGAPPPAPHVADPDCNACHRGYALGVVVAATHVDGKVDVVATSCHACHGSAASDAPPRGTRGETATTAIAVGAHQRHLAGGTLSSPVACGECHPVPAPDAMRHADGRVDLRWGALATGGGSTAPAWDRPNATCASTWCHGAFPGGNAANAPAWTVVDGSQDACGTCHGAPPAAPHPQNPACENCHAGYGRTTVNLATHVNGVVEHDPLGCTSCHGSGGSAAPPPDTLGETDPRARGVGAHQAHLVAGTLGPAVRCEECHVVPADVGHADGKVDVVFGPVAAHDGAAPVFDPVAGTCSGVYCHGATLRGNGFNLTPSWAGGAEEVTCQSCHLAPPPAPHPHTAICDSCHPGYTQTSVNLATHMNGLVEAVNLTCSSCHGDDSRVLTMQADPLAIAAPPFGSRGETDVASRSVGSHQAHVNRGNAVALPSTCDSCHVVPPPGAFGHANGVAEVTFGSLATMDGATPSFDGTTCANTYCHGATLGRGGTDHRPSWVNPTPVTCTTCHGAPPPLPHPQDGDCIRCHPGYTQTSVRQATHVNGISDFPNGCNSCHDAPPATGAHYEHLQHHVDCGKCHAGYTATTANETLHRNAKQDVTLSGWDPAHRTCSNIGCHGSEYWGRSGTAARTSCNQCHGVPPASGQHYEHSEYACSRCHGAGYSTTTTGATHMNGVVDVPYAMYDRATRSCGSGTGSCHGSEPWGTPKPVTPNCANCHGFPPSLPHPQDAACQSCHPSMLSTGVLTAQHNNGTLDVSGVGCQACHGAPPTSTRRGAVHPADANCYGCHSTTVDAQNQIVPNGTHNDGFVQVGGGGVGTYGCQSCHGDQARAILASADPQTKAAPPLGTRGEVEASTRAVGAHLAHVSPGAGALAQPARCDECHVVPTAMDHANGIAVVTLGGRATLQGASGGYDPATATCASTYCHGATLGAGGTRTAPSWVGGSAEAACGTCHGAPPPAPHPQSYTCGGCHDGYGPGTVNAATHVNGTVELSATACASCHGSARNAAPPFGTRGETATTTVAVGAHQQHLQAGPLSGPIACAECHVLPTAFQHSDGAAQVVFGTLAATGGATPAWDAAAATCATTYCHGQFAGGNLLNAPSWTTVDGTQAACGTCHGAPPPAPHPASASCGGCHPGYTATSVDVATHVDGVVQHSSPHPAGFADRTAHGVQVNTSGFATCTECHGADLAGGTSGASCGACHASAGTADWTTSCTFCHGSRTTGRANPPQDIRGGSATTSVTVGTHESHMASAIAAVACSACHPPRSGSVLSDRAHLDGNGIAEVVFGGVARTGGVTPTYTRTSATSASCASTYCHGNFSGGPRATMSFTSTTQVTCTSCHGSPPGTGHHSTHAGRAACLNCHNGVVSSSNGIVDRTLHVNGVKNVKFGGTYGSRTVTGTWNPTSRSCSSLSCHGSESW